MRQGDFLADGQAQSGAMVAAMRPAPEPFEEHGQLRGIDAADQGDLCLQFVRRLAEELLLPAVALVKPLQRPVEAVPQRRVSPTP